MALYKAFKQLKKIYIHRHVEATKVVQRDFSSVLSPVLNVAPPLTPNLWCPAPPRTLTANHFEASGYKTRSPEGGYQSAVCVAFRPMKRETRTSSILTSRKIHPEAGYPADIRPPENGFWPQSREPASGTRDPEGGYPPNIRDVTEGICKLRESYNYRK